MELQALLVLGGLGVAGAAVLLLMGLFSTSGTSYEEAVAQQRRAATELLALAESKAKGKKGGKKANKKLAKKERSKESSAANNSEPESEALAESGMEEDGVPSTKPHVEFSPDIVVDLPRDTPPNVKIRKRGKDPKVKPILLNKDDPSCLSNPSTPPTPDWSPVSNHFEETHPKDEFELMHPTHDKQSLEKKEDIVEKKEPKASKQAKGKSGKQVTAEAAPASVSASAPAKDEATTRERTASGDGPKEQRRGKRSEKKSQSDEVAVEAVREEVVPPLNAPQPGDLTTEKLLRQALVNAAPAPQPMAAHPTPPGGKKKKKQEQNLLALMAGDGGGINVHELVRVVSEAALSRNEIQLLTDTLLNKQHDPLPQHSDWSEGPNDPMQKLKKQLADKEKALADETEASQALHAKLKELRTSLNAERSRAGAAQRSAEDSAAETHALQARLQRLAEDHHALAQEKLMMQKQLGAEAEAQAQRVQMELHIQRLSEAEAALIQQLSALQAELNGRVLEAGQARCEAGAAREAALIAQQHAAELASQLQEANRVCSELDAQRQNAIHAEQAAQQELRQLQERLAAIPELQAEVQRATSRAQQAAANADKIKEDADKLKQQLSSQITSLQQQLAAKETALAEAEQLRVAAPAPALNGLPPSSDQHKASELAKVEGVISSLRAELIAAQTTSKTHRDQVAALQAQLQAYQDKNNDLRTKNWKVMEALQSAEKSLQMKSTSALPAQDSLREAIAKAQEAQYGEVASVLRAACPRVAPAAQPSRAWLEAFAQNLRKELEQAKVVAAPAPAPAAVPAVDESRLKEMRDQNEQLQGLVDKYKKIIDDTEGVLSRLQHNVTAEERRWTQQLADKQRELDDLRTRTVTQMQSKIDALQAELRTVQSSQNHNLADAERLNEERLLGLAKLDSCNGPSKVGLEDFMKNLS